jgi:hypothetical protein
MKVKLLLGLLLFGIAPLVLLVLGCWIERLLRARPHERRVRARLWHAAGASRGLCWTACGAVALPEPLVRRWNSPYLYRNDWETMAALSERFCDDIRIMSRCSDRRVPMCLRWPPQTRHGRLKLPNLGPKSPN